MVAEWRNLALVNYAIDPGILKSHTPPGTELDSWNGTTLVSVVGFRFLKTRVMGCALPFHRDFDEINLRFYVRRRVDGDWRRGVVFIREVVSRRAIAAVANWLYKENYVVCPTKSRIILPRGRTGGLAEYSWRYRDQWLDLRCEFSGTPVDPAPGSECEFITEHYWGYSTPQGGYPREYEVEHPRWRVWEATTAGLAGDVEAFYGSEFAEVLSADPASAFLAEGSRVQVKTSCTLEGSS